MRKEKDLAKEDREAVQDEIDSAYWKGYDRGYINGYLIGREELIRDIRKLYREQRYEDVQVKLP